MSILVVGMPHRAVFWRNLPVNDASPDLLSPRDVGEYEPYELPEGLTPIIPLVDS